jgi:hypothetical protein
MTIRAKLPCSWSRRGSAVPALRSLLLASAILSSLAAACTGQASQKPAAAPASCAKTRYLVSVHPRTMVSNQRDRLSIQATADACGHRAPVARARVRLGRLSASTDARGRATLTVKLATGRYSVRLYVHRRLVARARVSAIPNVSR